MARRVNIFVESYMYKRFAGLCQKAQVSTFIFDKIPSRWAGCHLALENATKILALRAMGHNLSYKRFTTHDSRLTTHDSLLHRSRIGKIVHHFDAQINIAGTVRGIAVERIIQIEQAAVGSKQFFHVEFHCQRPV